MAALALDVIMPGGIVSDCDNNKEVQAIKADRHADCWAEMMVVTRVGSKAA